MRRARALLFCLFVSTLGTAIGQELTLLAKHHSVLLKWKASPTPNVLYNVYRSTVHGSGYTRLNSKPVRELRYTDKDAKPGTTYYYVIRSMDGGGTESANSNEAVATIP
jgi:fibronectin type 3 domain-containing protein